MILTFSLPGRSSPSTLGSLDVLALAKVALRILVIAIMGYVFVQLEIHPKRGTVVRTLIPLGIFICWAILSTLWSPLKSASIGQAGGLLALSLLALNFGVLCDGKEDLSRILSNVSTCLFLISLAVLLIYFTFPSAGSMQREGSGLLHATSTASTASLGMITLVGARLLWGWRWTGRLLAPAVVVYATVLILSANRTSIFLTILIVCVLIWMYGNRNFLTGVVFVICMLTAAYLTFDSGLDLALGSASATVSFVERGEATDLSDFSGRREMWQIIWNSFLESPWYGHGYFVSSSAGEIYAWYQWAKHVLCQIDYSTEFISLSGGVISLTGDLLRLDQGGRRKT